MPLRRIRRLRFALLPIYAIALAGLQGRLIWAHDPSCPHHQGQAQHQSTPSAASPTEQTAPSGQTEHAGGTTHTGHAMHAGHATAANHASHTVATPAADTASPTHHAPEVPCQCVDPTCSITGVVALAAAPAATEIAIDLRPLAEAPALAPETITPPGAYTSHRLPYPLAPPRSGRSS